MLKNTIFVVCVVSTFVAVYCNYLTQEKLIDTFTDLKHEANRAHQLSIAQEYATQLSTVTEYEVIRAHELEESLDNLVRRHMKSLSDLERLNFEFEMMGKYLQQLIDFIEENNLDVPLFGDPA